MKTMKHGTYKFGDVIIAEVYFTDLSSTKRRPALVLFEKYNNVVVAGITSNTDMIGIPITKKEGAVVDSVIILNYIFTLSKKSIYKKVFKLSSNKKSKIKDELIQLIN